ncbi:MAG TPA: UDP-N-acetylmuramoyl-tripeptide--D-alanyl-D-alanine ligase [Gammaproteobacteria bacterium]|nr:UDP-N-acetylmuramoyl-tripeptide--D-alanyl-D-alanine ligase [Gammaproteobacteria bacterium]
MMSMRLSEAASVLDGQMSGSDVDFMGISTDTRTLSEGALFFALQGPNFDGHAYVETARERGAAAAAVSEPCNTLLPRITVTDTRLALGRLSADWRRRFQLPVIGITGSNGKTSVRAMTSAILARCGRTLSTQGNLNNDIGLPLTLARLSPDDRFAILEMGANHHGEIDYLAGIARPTIAVVTNAGPAHLEGFGDVAGVARAKGELFARLDSDGVAIINADDAYAPLWRELSAHCRRIEFGLDADCAVTAEWSGDADGSDITLYTPEGETRFRLPLPGRHNVMNALAASAAAQAAGAGLEDIRAGLAGLVPVAGRFNIHHLPGDITVIDDTYNANPGSLQVALDVLGMAGGTTWLVLGDMGELGEESTALHAAAGRGAREVGVERVFTLGELAKAAADSFGRQGESFSSLDGLVDALTGKLQGPLHILIKGSRRMRMERVVEALLSWRGV